MGRLVLDHAVSSRPPEQHSSLVTPLISTMSHRWSWLCCSQHIPAGDRGEKYTMTSETIQKSFLHKGAENLLLTNDNQSWLTKIVYLKDAM